MRLTLRCQKPRMRWKNVFIGNSGGRTKCVNVPGRHRFYCPSNSGNKRIRQNRDFWNANDRFHVYASGKNKVCAQRQDRRHGWGMKLVVKCQDYFAMSRAAAGGAFEGRAQAAASKCTSCSSCNRCQFCATCKPSGNLLCGALTVMPRTGGGRCQVGWHHPIEWINYGRGMKSDRGRGIVGGWWRPLDVMTTFPQPVTITGVKTDWSRSSYEVHKSRDGGKTWIKVGVFRGSAKFRPFTTSVARYIVHHQHGRPNGIHMQFVGVVKR